MTDLIIAGAGTAGLTAAIYAVRAGLDVQVVEQGIYGGQIITTNSIENYPGMPGVSGADFAVSLYKQAEALGAEILYETVREAVLEGPVKALVTSRGRREAHAMILATGAQPRHLGCPGEERLIGRGISFCATCDGAFHRGKEVVVVGGGNVALDDALVLAGLCSRVYLVHRSSTFKGEAHTLRQLRERENVTLLTDSQVEEFRGEEKLEGAAVRHADGSLRELAVSGAFIAVGSVPNTALFREQLALDASGYIVAGEDCKTSLPGVFAAGDNRTKRVRQIVTASADGAVAALAAKDYIDSL